ncbi:MAG: acyl-CoA thioesterase [Acidaminococcaceae bacterium]|nr:acyl-CoA thioesterase [Acidaminococcaceae bacterium]
MDLYKHRVEYYETDRMGITHHSNYIRWMEEARTNYFMVTGMDYREIEKKGYYSPVIRAEMQFLKTSTYEDVVTIDVQLAEYDNVKFAFDYVMTKEDGTVIFRGRSEHCFMTVEGRPVRVDRVMPEVAEIFRSHIPG